MTSLGHVANAYKYGNTGYRAIHHQNSGLVLAKLGSREEKKKKKKKKKENGSREAHKHITKKQSNGGGERRDQKGPLDRAGGPPTGLNRTGKSCRLRWVNYLHPGLKRGRMTPQEEQLVLELHAKWGNRWSRIARRLPGRTDNEIKNYWRTHMRKKAQERKRSSSTSLSSSSSSNLSSSRSEPPSDVVMEKHELDRVGKSNFLITGFEENEVTLKGYPMDQIWNEIAASTSVSDISFEEYRDEGCNIPGQPMPSPMWDYCSDPLWRVDDEELNMLTHMGDLTTSNCQQGIESSNH